MQNEAIIEKILQNIDTDAYLDDCCLFTDKDFEHHVGLIDKLLTALSYSKRPFLCDYMGLCLR